MMAVAVKEICISDRSRRQQVLKEIETLRAATASAASHLMTYLGVRYTEGSIQIVMEYMDGGSLGDLVARHGPLSCDALAVITQQTLLALVQLRELRLVHRDLKPQVCADDHLCPHASRGIHTTHDEREQPSRPTAIALTGSQEMSCAFAPRHRSHCLCAEHPIQRWRWPFRRVPYPPPHRTFCSVCRATSC